MNSSAELRPLRRTGFVDLLYGTLARYWRRLPFSTSVSAVIWVPAFALQVLIAFALGVPGRIQSVQPSTASSATGAILLAYAVGVLAIMFVAGTLSQGALIRAVTDEELAGWTGIREAIATGREAFWRLLGVLLVLAGIVVVAEVVVLLVFLLLVVALGFIGGGAQIPAIGIMFLVAGIAPLVVFARFVVSIPMTVAARSPVLASVRSSYDVLAGRYVPVLLLVLVISFMGWLVTAVANLVLSPTQGLGPGGGLVAADFGAAILAVLLGPLPASMFATTYLETSPPPH